MNQARHWTISWKDIEFTDEDLTAGELSACQLLVGEGWASVDPFAGPTQLCTLLYVVGCRLRGLTGDEAVDFLKEVNSLSGADVLNALSTRDASV